MGLLISQITFKVCDVVVKFRNILKIAIMATKLTVTFMSFAELSENPNFFDVPSNLPFSETSNRLLKNENPITAQ